MIKNSRVWIILLFAVGLTVYFPIFFAQYNIDDEYVTNNQTISKGFAAIPQIFTEKYVVSDEYAYGYRPITKLTYALEYAIFGKIPQVSHFINLIIYLISVWLLYNLLKTKLLVDTILAQLITIVFLLHPLHTEVVCSLKNREELLVLLLFFVFYNQITKFIETKKWLNLVLSAATLLIGVLTKLTAVLYIPFAIILLIHSQKVKLFLPTFITNNVAAPHEKQMIKWQLSTFVWTVLTILFLIVKLQTTWQNKDVLQVLSFLVPAVIFVSQNNKNKPLWKSITVYFIFSVVLFITSFFYKGNYRLIFYVGSFVLPPLVFLIYKIIILFFYKNLQFNKWVVSIFGLLLLLLYASFLWFTKTFEPDAGMALHAQNPLYVNQNFWLKGNITIQTFWFYFKQLLFPQKMLFYYGYNTIVPFNFFQITNLIKLTVLLLFFGFSFWFQFKNKLFATGFWLFIIGFIPFSNLFFPVAGIVGERLIYMSSLGFCLIVVVPFYNLATTRFIQYKLIFIGLAAVVFIAFGYKTFTRAQQWQNKATLLFADMPHLNNSVRAQALYANEILINPQLQTLLKIPQNSIKKYEMAVNHFEKAVKTDSSFFNGWNNLGSLYFEVFNDFSKAENAFKNCLKYGPNNPAYYLNLAMVYEHNKKYNQALNTYENGINLFPNNFELYLGSAYCAYYLNNFTLAVKYLSVCQKLNPQSPEVKNLVLLIN